jgi:hypothetical protein
MDSKLWAFSVLVLLERLFGFAPSALSASGTLAVAPMPLLGHSGAWH